MTNVTYWGWATDPKRSASENLTTAMDFHRDVYGGRLLAVRCRASLAAELGDAPIDVVADERVAVGLLLFKREVVA